MSVLKQKLDKAAQKFQTHCFREALELYEDCLSFCYRTDQSKQIIYNIMSTKGALLCILGDYQKSMSVLNQIIKSQPNHYLALIRRSQVYKKRGKLNRAYKDLDIISNFCPDNLQIVAMKIQIENLKSKNKNQNSSEESDSQEFLDEQVALNFSNLKKIDRKSCSIVINEKRKSRVTISGDTAVHYEIIEDVQCDKSTTAFSKQNIKEKYQKTFTYIDIDQNNQQSYKDLKQVVNIVVKTNTRTKSILKNRGASIVNQLKSKTEPTHYGGRQSKLVQNIKNIDGKMLSSIKSISQKQVEFRKSIHFDVQIPNQMIPLKIQEKMKNKQSGGRKSCLKRCSFENVQAQVKKSVDKPARRSKFQMLTRNSIDGHLLKGENIPAKKRVSNSNESQSDQNQSQHNIFGSEILQLPQQITQMIGHQQNKKKEKEKTPKLRGSGKSILKRSSVFTNDFKASLEKEKQQQPSNATVAKKVKKSVMFNKSRFAE